MKGKLLTVGLLVASNACLASTFTGRAEVIDSRPVFVEVSHPVQVCEQDEGGYVQQAPQQSAAGSILGGLIGGLAGHQVGHGGGKTAATIAGALGGAYLGNRIATQNGQSEYEQPQAQCHMEDRRTREARGYQVTYRFAGRTFTENLPYDPGNSVRVNVSVSAVN